MTKTTPALPGEYATVELARKDEADVRFEGRLLASTSNEDDARRKASDEADRTKKNVPARWTELEVWELASGDWLAVSVACSEKSGEQEFGKVVRVPRKDEERNQRDDQAMRVAACDAFGWTWLTKRLATDAGWSVVKELR